MSAAQPSTASTAGATLRPMRWWDLEAVALLEQAVFAPSEAWSAEQLWAELAGVPETRRYFVACDEAAVLGYAGMAHTVAEADVLTVVVAAPARRRGLGARLVVALLREADALGLSTVFLEVRADNAVARRLYERLGFAIVSRRPGYYGPGRDAVVMSRRGRGHLT